MPLPIPKDSLSRCEQPSMLYDTIRNPHAPKTPPKPVSEIAATQDTIETTQERLNREMTERFQNTSSRMPHQSFVVAAQVGKYLFLAIMLPPYICFYGIPRWFLMDALPQFFIMTKTQMYRVGNFFSELAKHTVDVMKGILEQMLGDAMRMLNQPFKNMLGAFSKGYQGIANTLKQLANALQKGNGFARKSLQGLSDKFSKNVKQMLYETTELIKEQSLRLVNQITHLAAIPFNLVQNGVIQPILKWMGKQSARLTSAAKAVQNSIKRTSSSLVNGLKRSFKFLYSTPRAIANNLASLARKFAANLFEPPAEWIRGKLEAIKRTVDSTKSRVARSLSKVASAARSSAETVFSSTAHIVQQAIQITQVVVVQIGTWLGELTSPVRERWRRGKESAGRWKRKFKGVGSSLYKGFLHKGKGAVQYSVKISGWLKNLIKLAFFWLLQQLIALPRKVIRLCIWLGKVAYRVIRQVFRTIRLFFTWMWIAFGYGMMLVRELSHEMGSWFSEPVKK